MKMNLILTFFLSQLFVVLCCAEAKAGNARARFLSANNAMHFAWLNDNTVVKGDSRDHFSKVSSPQSTRPRIPYAFGIQAFKNRPTKIKDVISISSNDSMHFAWLIERVPKGDPEYFLWVCAGPSNTIGLLEIGIVRAFPKVLLRTICYL